MTPRLRVALRVLAACGMLLLAGLMPCHPRLGTNDVELDYRPEHGAAAPALWLVRARLEAAQIRADVSEYGIGGVRVVATEPYSFLAESSLRSPGGFLVARYDAAAGETTTPALLELERVTARADGNQVIVDLDEAAAAQLALVAPTDPIGVTYAHRLIWRGPLRTCFQPGSHLLVLGPTVADPRSYGRARRIVRLLEGPTLPPLHPVAHDPLPIDWSLALACIGLPIAVALAWMFFVRRIDRAQPEPWWLMITTVALGALGQQAAAFVESHAVIASQYLDHHAMALDLAPSAFPLSLLLCFLVVGVVEEGAKLLAVWLVALHRREFDEPIDGIVYACAAAIGFAAMENIDYFTFDRIGDGELAGRSLEAMSGHMMYAALWGYALGQRLVSPRPRLLAWFALAAGLHALWDTVLTFGIPWAPLAQIALCTVLFVVVVRRALARPVLPAKRRVPFVLAVVCMYGFAYLLVELGRDADWNGYRVSFDLLVRSAGFGSLFVVAAWAVAALMQGD